MFTKILTIITKLCPWSFFQLKICMIDPDFFFQIEFVINRKRNYIAESLN